MGVPKPPSKGDQWEEPTDASIVSVPNGWTGGAVENSGGGIYCRRWYSETNREELSDGDERLVVSYDGGFESVEIGREKYDADGDYFDYYGPIKKKAPDKQTDKAAAQVALELMQEHI